MKTFKIQDENILRRLEKRYKVHLVQFNIMTGNFAYTKDGNKKRISFDSLINIMEHEENKDIELFNILNSLKCSYFPERIKSYFVDFYEQCNLSIPRDIFITRGFIEFYDKDNQIFYLPYMDDIDIVLLQAKKYIQGGKCNL